MEFQIEWAEDGSADVLARITARDATGEATGVAGEGRWLKVADISTITCKVFNIDSSTPDTAIATPTVDKTTDVLDTPVTTDEIWTKDSVGYNFLHSLAASNFPEGSKVFSVEYEVTLTGGGKFHGVFSGPARPIRTS